MDMPARWPGFTDIDRNEDPQFFLGALDRLHVVYHELRQQTCALLDVREGQRLLDVGCGTGEVVRALAQRVGSTGRAVGVDISETMIGEARRRAQGASPPSEYRLGDVYHLDFVDNEFDGCRAERVFIHLDDPLRALMEMCRVTRPGGHIVIAEPDLEARMVDSPDRGLTRRLLNYICDQVRNGWIARQLPRLFKRAGLADIAILPHTIVVTDLAQGIGGQDVESFCRRLEQAQADGVVSKAEAERWLQELRKANEEGRSFSAVTIFIVSGRKP
jgi:ubiquinone/menaquinone biosynthesis C-methylase UbiE